VRSPRRTALRRALIPLVPAAFIGAALAPAAVAGPVSTLPTTKQPRVATIAPGITHERIVRSGGPLHANNGRMLAALAVEGAGVVCEPDFILGPDIARGALVPILADWKLPAIAIHVAYPSRRHLSAKVRAFVDYLAERLAAWQ